MKLTIAVDDISIPLPPMVTPDVRQRILEHVIELAARAGVDDLEIVVADRAAPAHDRRPRSGSMVGERVYRSFWPKALYNLDAEDTANMIDRRADRPRRDRRRSRSAPPSPT